MGSRKAILLLGVILAAALVVALVNRKPEPSFEGKSLSQLLSDYKQNALPNGDPAKAVRQIGTNALPFLLAQLQAEDSRAKRLLISALGQSRVERIGFSTAAQRRDSGRAGFCILGPAAKPAIPDLVKLLAIRSTAWDAATALTFLYPEGLGALTNALRRSGEVWTRVTVLIVLKNEASNGHLRPEAATTYVPLLASLLDDADGDCRAFAAETLAYLDYRREALIPGLIKLLRDSETSARYAAAMTLGEFGSQANAALPAMVDYAKRSGNATERENAILAIEKIDPRAAEQLKKELEAGAAGR